VTHPERLEDYLEHMAEAIVRATEYLRRNDDLPAFQKDLHNQDAVVRNIEIIGEAASQIQRMHPEFVQNHPEIPGETYVACETR
jgi:uncharacterized protein with HEPN domain